MKAITISIDKRIIILVLLFAISLYYFSNNNKNMSFFDKREKIHFDTF